MPNYKLQWDSAEVYGSMSPSVCLRLAAIFGCSVLRTLSLFMLCFFFHQVLVVMIIESKLLQIIIMIFTFFTDPFHNFNRMPWESYL